MLFLGDDRGKQCRGLCWWLSSWRAKDIGKEEWPFSRRLCYTHRNRVTFTQEEAPGPQQGSSDLPSRVEVKEGGGHWQGPSQSFFLLVEVTLVSLFFSQLCHPSLENHIFLKWSPGTNTQHSFQTAVMAVRAVPKRYMGHSFPLYRFSAWHLRLRNIHSKAIL